MFNIYIKNYNFGDQYITDENLLYSIPFDPEDENVLTDPKVSGEMGKQGSFEFSMNPKHPYYRSLLQMITIFRVEYDGDTIFRGRVLTIDVGHLTGIKNVHCEGDLAFLLDSQIEGITDDDRPKTNAITYINSLVNAHNSQMNEGMADKKFTVGEVPGTYTNATESPQRVAPDSDYRYGSGSWRDSQSAFNELADTFGGYFRTRYQNGICYLDWIDQYFRGGINVQTIELGKNLIDITSNSEVNNIFTALIPVGSKNGKSLYINGYKTNIHGNNKRILVPQIAQVYSDAQLNQGFHTKEDYLKAIDTYGIIYHTETFSNADTQEKLWAYACDWIKNNYIGGLNSFDIGALDMHLIGKSSGKFLVGDKVNVIYPDVENRDTDPEAIIQKVMTVMSISYDLHHPEKNSYKIGFPNGILKKNYGEKQRKSKSKNSGSNKKKQKQEGDEDGSKKAYDNKVIWTFVQDGAHNSVEYQKYKEKYGDEAADAIQKSAYLVVDKVVNEGDKRVASMILDGHADQFSFNDPKANEYDATLRSIVLDGRDYQIKLGQNPKGLDPDYLKATELPAFFMVQSEPDGAKITMAKPGADQTPQDPLKSTITTVVDSVKGQVDTSVVNLTDIEKVKDVVDGDVDAKVSLDGAESTASFGDGVNNFLNLFGLGGENNKSGGVKVSTEEEDPDTGEPKAVTTTLVDGFTGFLTGLGINLGGNKETGVEPVASGENKPEIKMDGVEGKEWVGLRPDGTWRVKLNDTITYTDEDGNQQTAPGFVSAEDFKLPNIKSFKTQLAVIDRAIIGKATIAQLEAVQATIDEIFTDKITANTYVSAANGLFGKLYGRSLYTLGDPDAGGDSSYVNVASAFNRATFTTGTGDDEGKIFLNLYSINGSPLSINFNIAETKTYKDGVSAAKASVTIKTGSWVYNSDPKRIQRTVSTDYGQSKIILPPRVNMALSGKTVTAYYADDDDEHAVAAKTFEVPLETKTVTANGTYTPSAIYAGFDSVTVNLSTEEKTITANGTYTPSGSNVGFSSVTINVPSAPSHDDSITWPSSGSSNNMMVSAVINGEAVSKTFYVLIDSMNAYIRDVNSTAGGTTLAKVTNITSGLSSHELSSASATPYEGITDKGTLDGDKYYKVTATPKAGTASVFQFKVPGASDFTLTTVTPQGSAHADITPIGSSSLYLGSKTATAVYFKKHTVSEKPTGTWYTKVTQEAQADLAYADVGSTGTWYHTVSKNGTRYYKAGSKVTGLYNAGTPVTNVYYIKKS